MTNYNQREIRDIIELNDLDRIIEIIIFFILASFNNIAYGIFRFQKTY